ncbi:MAG: dihydrofolate reductase family protein [Bacteroidota bacterium]
MDSIQYSETHKWLHRCQQLARLGGSHLPNPLGVLIVYQSKIIGEAFREAGGPHDTIRKALQQIGTDQIAAANLFLSRQVQPEEREFESIQAYSFASVFVASQNASVFSERVQKINQQSHRPYISLKWAQSADGYLAAYDEQGFARTTKISGFAAAVFTHRLRAEHQAILVGANTANIDNPRLDTRFYPGPNPRPVVLGTRENLKPNLRLLQGSKQAIIGHPQQAEKLEKWVQDLYRQEGIRSMLVEGGAKVLEQFIAVDLYDDLYRYSSQTDLGAGIKAPILPENFPFSGKIKLGVDQLDWRRRPL